MEATAINSFLLERLCHNTEIRAYVYQEGACVLQVPKQEEDNILDCDRQLLEAIIQEVNESEKPIIFMEEFYVYFGAFCDPGGNYFIFGPVSRKEMSEQKQVSYFHKHKYSGKRFPIVKQSLELISSILSIACYGYCGKCVTEEDIFVEWQKKEKGDVMESAEMEHYQIDKSEMNRTHDSVEYENQLVAAVEKGNITAMKQLLHVNIVDADKIGTVAQNELKQMEYLCVTLTCMVSRAAIRGGMNPEEAYDLSDVYLQKLEKCKTLEEMGLLFMKMPMDYTERVKRARDRKKGNIYVEKAKDYIARNLRKEFQIQDMAESLGVSRSYMSKMFTQQEGVTIQQYIIGERLGHAANMLKFTDYDISVIAEYFCFATQSHFGKQFKERFGMTPSAYRRQNRYVESFNRE